MPVVEIPRTHLNLAAVLLNGQSFSMALLLVMGLPAAGKSTLCRQLVADCHPNATLFSFDDFSPPDSIPGHSARKSFERAVRSCLQKIPGWHLVVVDDNLYLKSMRRPFERMARALGFSFHVAVVTVSLDDALARNASRSQRVAEDTIRRMNEEMELSEECQEVKDYEELKKRVLEAKRTPPVTVAEPTHATQPLSIGERNEMAMRRCVQRLVKAGLDGKRLSRAKKTAWEALREAREELEEREIEEALRRNYWLVAGNVGCRTVFGEIYRLPHDFRWLELGGHFYGTAREKMWKIRRLDDKKVEYEVLASISGKAECSKEEETHFRDYFNLSIDMDELYSTWSKVDPHIKLLLSDSDDLKGIRILNQDPVETLFAFICSANNNIKRISKMVNRLCSLYGSPLVLLDGVGEVERRVAEECPQLMYAFPTVAQLAENVADMQEQLSEDSFGYRAGYIAGSVKHFINMKEDLDRLRFPQEARERLLAFSGVGPKVADCVSLMGLGHHHVVPIDTHVYKSTVKHYRKDLEGKSLTNALHTSLGQFYKDKFGTHAGWAQAILFNAQLQASPAKRAKKTKNGVVEKEK